MDRRRDGRNAVVAADGRSAVAAADAQGAVAAADAAERPAAGSESTAGAGDSVEGGAGAAAVGLQLDVMDKAIIGHLVFPLFRVLFYI